MSQRPTDIEDGYEEEEEDEELEPASSSVAVIDAHSAFRLLLILVAIWSFIEGFALFTGGIEALSLNSDRMAERIIGAQMLVLSGAFGLLAWRREQFRLMLWLPYAAQLAIIIPVGMSIFSGSSDGALLFVVSLIFFVLLFYFWYHSHPLEHFAQVLEEDDEEEADDEPDDEAEWEAAPERAPRAPASPNAAPPTTPAASPQATRRASKFRRRDS